MTAGANKERIPTIEFSGTLRAWSRQDHLGSNPITASCDSRNKAGQCSQRRQFLSSMLSGLRLVEWQWSDDLLLSNGVGVTGVRDIVMGISDDLVEDRIIDNPRHVIHGVKGKGSPAMQDEPYNGRKREEDDE